MSSASKVKGSRIEREIRDKLLELGVPAKKMPLSGLLGGEYAGDLLVANKFRAEVKARKNGTGFTVINNWLGDNSFLFVKENNVSPKIIMQWDVYIELLKAWCEKNGVTISDNTPPV